MALGMFGRGKGSEMLRGLETIRRQHGYQVESETSRDTLGELPIIKQSSPLHSDGDMLARKCFVGERWLDWFLGSRRLCQIEIANIPGDNSPSVETL